MVGDPGIEPGVRLREGVTVPCHTLRPVAHFELKQKPRFGHDYDLENRASTRKLPYIGSSRNKLLNPHSDRRSAWIEFYADTCSARFWGPAQLDRIMRPVAW